MTLFRRVSLPLFSTMTLGLFLCLCSRDIGQNPIGPGVDDQKITIPTGATLDSVSKNMAITVSPSVLAASFVDSALVTVRVRNNTNNPVSGKVVTFQARYGTIYGVRDTTDAAGTATAIYHSVQRNVEDTIIAAINSNDTLMVVGKPVTLQGMKIAIIPETRNALTNKSVQVTVSLLDGKQEPVAGAQIVLAGVDKPVTTTRGDGSCSAIVTSATEEAVAITASGLGATTVDTIRFWTTIPTGVDTVKGVRSLRIFASKSQLKADNSDTASITAIVTNQFNNPATAEKVVFRTDLGIINDTVVVGADGRAHAQLHSAPVNGVCIVKAFLAGREHEIRDSTSVLFNGVTLRLSTLTTELSANSTAAIDVLLTDGSGNAIGNQSVVFTVTSAIGKFTNGSTRYTASLDANGKSTAQITSPAAGRAVIRASALNTEDSLGMTFTLSNISISSFRSSILADSTDFCTITAKYVDNAGNGIAGAWILFASNAGTIVDDSVKTAGDGTASTILRGASFTGIATVQAKSPGGSATTTIQFLARAPQSLVLTTSPDNIGVNGGSSVLTAIVKDTNGNMVSGANVKFRILKGPGGGEHIDHPMTVSVNGLARTQIFAGSVPSMYRACEVEASVGDLVATSKLTISGEPYTITVSRPEDDTIPVPDGGLRDPSVFECNVGAVVQDVNGNPVADGTPVHFSAVVSGEYVMFLRFVRWEVTADKVVPIMMYVGRDVPFEDINNNLTMDPNVDLRINYDNSTASRGDDVNGDGVMDYKYETNGLKWPFEGYEPYYPALGFTPVLNDTGKSDTTIDSVVQMVVTPVILGGGASVRFDTTYQWHRDTLISKPKIDSIPVLYADLNRNGKWDKSPIDTVKDVKYNPPASGDFEWWRWEMRPQYLGHRFDFTTNDYAVTIPASITTTKNGVAEARVTYPRQFARRLFVSVNAEVNGIRDRDGERFVLPQIK